MGQSVQTLVSTYVGALDGDEVVANDRIDTVLTGPKTKSAPNRITRKREEADGGLRVR
ncbi:MAG: hypothetical protein NVS3B21_36020 [Acidimicrobiales bacterium]